MKTNLHTIHTEYFDSFYPNKTKIEGRTNAKGLFYLDLSDILTPGTKMTEDIMREVCKQYPPNFFDIYTSHYEFWLSASAQCNNTDNESDFFGKKLALDRLQQKAFRKAYKVYGKVIEEYDKYVQNKLREIHKCFQGSLSAYYKCTRHIEDLIEQPEILFDK